MSSHRDDTKRHHVPDAPFDPAEPTNERPPKRRRGGQELPDSVQDRPEQNAGYDAAVHGDADIDAQGPSGEADLVPEERGADEERVPPESAERSGIEQIDDRAEQDAIRAVRRHERG